jgi:hypothetical protein
MPLLQCSIAGGDPVARQNQEQRIVSRAFLASEEDPLRAPL